MLEGFDIRYLLELASLIKYNSLVKFSIVFNNY